MTHSQNTSLSTLEYVLLVGGMGLAFGLKLAAILIPVVVSLMRCNRGCQ